MVEKLSLIIENLSYAYNRKIVLENINWTLHSGNIYVLLGPNGAGKTTFLNILADALQPTSGHIDLITLEGTKNKEQLRENIGYLTEFPYYYPFLTTSEMIKLVGQLKGLEDSTVKHEMNRWIELLELDRFLNQTVGSLSQGTKKRIAFLTAIIHKPKILLLDEPTNGLDPEQIIIFRSILKDLSESGVLILLSTHSMGLAEKIAHKIGIIRNQQLIYTGDNNGNLEELYLNMQ